MNRDDVNLLRLRQLAIALGDVAEGEIVQWAIDKISELEKQPRWISFKFEPELEDPFEDFSGLVRTQPVRRIRAEYIDAEGKLWNLSASEVLIQDVAAAGWQSRK